MAPWLLFSVWNGCHSAAGLNPDSCHCFDVKTAPISSLLQIAFTNKYIALLPLLLHTRAAYLCLLHIISGDCFCQSTMQQMVLDQLSNWSSQLLGLFWYYLPFLAFAISQAAFLYHATSLRR